MKKEKDSGLTIKFKKVSIHLHRKEFMYVIKCRLSYDTVGNYSRVYIVYDIHYESYYLPALRLINWMV